MALQDEVNNILNYGTPSNFTKGAIPTRSLGTVGGVDINIFGGPLTPFEHHTVLQTMQSLTHDYPDIGLSKLTLFNTTKYGDYRTEEMQYHAEKFLKNRGLLGTSSPGPGALLKQPDRGGAIYLGLQNIRRGIESGDLVDPSVGTQAIGKSALEHIDTPLMLRATIEHEFGHQIHHHLSHQYSDEATKKYLRGAILGRDLEGGEAPPGYVESIIEGLYKPRPGQKYAEQWWPQKLEATYEKLLKPLEQQAFGEIPSQLSTETLIGSKYGDKSANERFAEIFARGRIREGKGAKQARSMERELQSKISRIRKIESNNRNVTKMLGSMGSSLR